MAPAEQSPGAPPLKAGVNDGIHAAGEGVRGGPLARVCEGRGMTRAV